MALCHSSDTIAAIATAQGDGGIGIIRLSGPDALKALQAMFTKKAWQDSRQAVKRKFVFTPRRLEHGWILDRTGRPLDEVMAVYLPGPHSFSGEDITEIHCHGGRTVTVAVLESALEHGARMAEPGEFTRRAFLNGRIDLSQAEAVAEIIAAPTAQGVYLARNKLEGRLGQSLETLRQKLDWFRAGLYLAIDFPDDAAEHSTKIKSEFQQKLAELCAEIEGLITAHDQSRLWREGALAVLAGKVNVGKSSLLNAMLGRKRALVSNQPGTTRDFIEENINIAGVPVRLVDTAGLRQDADALEAEGMQLASALLEQADIILLVQDILEVSRASPLLPGQPSSQEDFALWELFGPASGNNRIIVVLNKMDLQTEIVFPATLYGCPCVTVSAKLGSGLEALLKQIGASLKEQISGLDFGQEVAPSLRQKHKLGEVLAELNELSAEYNGNVPAELISVRLDTAAAYLADVIGVSSPEQVLEQIFSEFCIGK